jgi:hypothetical protein
MRELNPKHQACQYLTLMEIINSFQILAEKLERRPS